MRRLNHGDAAPHLSGLALGAYISSDNVTALLAGSDPDLLVLRSSVLAPVGIWSLRVRTLEQARQVIGLVPFELAILCYTWDAQDRNDLIELVTTYRSDVRILTLRPGDDCSATSFLRKVRDLLASPVPLSPAIVEPFSGPLRMIR